MVMMFSVLFVFSQADAFQKSIMLEGESTPPYYTDPVETFFVILDASASKYLPHGQKTKLKIAKDILRRMNAKIPQRPLIGGLRVVGFEAGAFTEKTQLPYSLSNYSRGEYGVAIETVRWAGGKTHLTLAMDQTTEDLVGGTGNIAVIIVSDGKVKNDSPVDAAIRMKSRYGERLCIYTVQVANLPAGKEILERIVDIGGCGIAETADNLMSDESLTEWVDRVFSGRPRTPMAAVPEDSDRDGVPDHLDECPDTPIGARVDKRGCWILGRVQFDLDKYYLKPMYFPMLDEIAAVLKNNPDVKMEVQGHTCTIASEKYNLKLSQNRAIAVSEYLMKQGVPTDQLSIKAFGFSKPTASNRIEDGRIQNRRVEFRHYR